MAHARVVITKGLPFRGGLEEFSNGYTLSVDGASLDGTAWAALIQALVDIEKAFHSPLAQFIRGTGADGDGPIAHLRELNSIGLQGIGSTLIHPEVCVLAQATIRRGHYLAKYYHIGRLQTAPSTADSAVFVKNESSFTTNLPKLTNGTLPGGARVCNSAGDSPANPFTVDDYLRVHQFRRGNRRPE
jgi:hypothetical protein